MEEWLDERTEGRTEERGSTISAILHGALNDGVATKILEFIY